jgi:HEAT repeat protein
MRRGLAGKPEKDLPALAADMSSRDELLRYAAARGLAKHQDARALVAVATLLDDSSISVRRAALEAIKAQGKAASPAVIDELVAMLTDKDPGNQLLRQGASEALAAQGKAAVPAVRSLLESGPKDARLYAIRCLEQIGVPDPAAARILLDLFANRELANDRGLREAVILTLGKLKVAEALSGLLALLAADEGREREWVRVAAITALGNLGDRRAIKPLVEEYKHGYSNVEVYVFRWRLYESLTRLTGQNNAVAPSYEGWIKYLVEHDVEAGAPNTGGHN